MTTDVIDVEQILADTCIRRVEWHQELRSTNDLALEVSEEIPVPFLFGAERQTGGRGRGAHSWWSAPGSLLFSIGLDPTEFGLQTTDWPRFSLVTGLAVAATLQEVVTPSRVGLKWPNDVWIDHRKVCGILIEQSQRMADRLIVGIGINVNNSFQHAPEDVRTIATSVYDVGGRTVSRNDLLIAFLQRWRQMIGQVAEETFSLAHNWSLRCVLSGQAVTLTAGNRESTGICAGVDDDGSLLLRTAYTMERHYAGTVRLV